MDEEVTAVIPTGMPEEGRLEGVVRDRALWGMRLKTVWF